MKNKNAFVIRFLFMFSAALLFQGRIIPAGGHFFKCKNQNLHFVYSPALLGKFLWQNKSILMDCATTTSWHKSRKGSWRWRWSPVLYLRLYRYTIPYCNAPIASFTKWGSGSWEMLRQHTVSEFMMRIIRIHSVVNTIVYILERWSSTFDVLKFVRLEKENWRKIM